jgi:hypothetical protein
MSLIIVALFSTATFAAVKEPEAIKEVAVTDLKHPKESEALDTTIELSETSYSFFMELNWDKTADDLYRVTIKTRTYYDYIYDENTIVTINGKRGTVIKNEDSRILTFTYVFPNAPEVVGPENSSTMYHPITIMYMEKAMDSGDILSQESIKIEDTDNSDSLFKKLADLGARMINPTIDNLVNNKITPIPQNIEEVTFAYNINHDEELLDFNKTNKEIFNIIRGLSTNPGAYFKINGYTLKVYNSILSSTKTSKEPGTICDVQKNIFSVSCKDGTVISFDTIKPEGKGLMSVKDFMNGKGRSIIIEGTKLN